MLSSNSDCAGWKWTESWQRGIFIFTEASQRKKIVYFNPCVAFSSNISLERTTLLGIAELLSSLSKGIPASQAYTIGYSCPKTTLWNAGYYHRHSVLPIQCQSHNSPDVNEQRLLTLHPFGWILSLAWSSHQTPEPPWDHPHHPQTLTPPFSAQEQQQEKKKKKVAKMFLWNGIERVCSKELYNFKH